MTDQRSHVAGFAVCGKDQGIIYTQISDLPVAQSIKILRCLLSGQKVVIIDDLIATGGTMEAICKLIESLGGEVVRICFVMELAGLEGRKKLKDYPVESLIVYEGK